MKDDGSYIGGMITSRVDLNGNYNFLAAADVDLSLKRPHYFKMKLAQSVDPRNESSKSLMGSIVLHTRKRSGFSYGSSATHIGSKFNPGIGFLPRRGINRLGSRLGYIWFPESSSFVQSHGFTNRMEGIWNIETGKFETFSNRLNWEALFRSGATAQAILEITQEDLAYPFWIGNVKIDTGRYRFISTQLKYSTPSGLPFRLGIDAAGGGYYGGWRAGGTLSPSWTLSPNLTLLFEYNYSRAEVKNGIYDAHVARFRVKAALTRALTASAFMQYSSDLRKLSANIRIRFNPAEGNDFYIVYNEVINTTLGDQFPRMPRMSERTILIKYNYTFVR